VGNGKRSQDHDIQYLKCQACQKTFTSRKGTPMYYLKTKINQVEMVLWFLAEGVDLSVMVRVLSKNPCNLQLKCKSA
jgi:transposase-like protein